MQRLLALPYRPLPGGPSRTSERGATLLLTIVICALLSLLAVGQLARGRRGLQQTHQRIAQRQMEWAASGALTLAQAALVADPTRTVDHPAEPWGSPIGPIAIGSTACTLEVEDLQARLNLNNLGLREESTARAFALVVRNFLTVCEIPDAYRSAEAIQDWIDSNDLGWAEASIYQQRTPPHGAKNKPIDDLGELRTVQGIPDALWQRIQNPRVLQYPGAPADLLTILPHIADSSSWTRINLNTAPLPVLLALFGPAQRGAAESILLLREQGPILGVDRIAPLLPAGILDGARRWIDVRSDYYRVTVTVEQQTAALKWSADMNRLDMDRNIGLRLWTERKPDRFGHFPPE